MPQDLFRWDAGNALVHHCPHCQTPLTHARCRTKCLTKHVEWCKKYHCQLFKKGNSATCMACNASDDTHQKRHRAIAELLRQLEKLKEAEAAAPKPINGQPFVLPSDNSTSKRERKAAKKIEKATQRPKVVGQEQLTRVCHVLHPPEEKAGEEAEREHLLNDPAIMANLPYHRGTSTDRFVRIELIANDAKAEFEVTKTEMDRIMQELGIPQTVKGMKAEGRRLVQEVLNAIKIDLVAVHREDEETMQRKAGFWRWANRRAFNKLVRNGSIRGNDIREIELGSEEAESEDEDHKFDSVDDASNGIAEIAISEVGDIEAQTSESTASSDAGRFSDNAQPDTSDTLSTVTTSPTTSSPTSSISDRATPKVKQGEWKIAGKATPKNQVKPGASVSLKLSSNKGLNHLRGRPNSKSPAFNGFSWLDADDVDSDPLNHMNESPTPITRK